MNLSLQKKELVTLRRRATKGGGESLYLDYMIDGVRTREFLKMYLIPERNKVDKALNHETMKLAEAIKARRILELQEGRAGFRKRPKRDMRLTDYIDNQIEYYTSQGKASYALTLGKIRKWLEDYGKKTSLLTVDKDYVIDFCRHLKDSGLSQGTVHMYFANLNTIFNNAYRADLMVENPISRIDRSQRPKKPETEREYLTLEEVKKLVDTPCKHEEAKRAFLFSCFTGLRSSDVRALRWEKIRATEKGYQVQARMLKTGGLIYVPLSANAMSFLGPMKTSGPVFTLPGQAWLNEIVSDWAKSAGITKHISFHTSRHTNATLLISYGADLYTVKALLGHKDIETTQIYAKIIDDKKVRAVDMIPEI